MSRYDEALADFSRAIELDPSNAFLAAERGKTYRAMGRYDEALADFSRAIELDPSNAFLAAERGMTYREMGRYDEALADFSRAIELDPGNALLAADAVRPPGDSRYDEALADFSRAIELDPSNAFLAAERGQTYRAMGRYDEALVNFSRAIELDPSNASLAAERGETYQEMGRYPEALADFDQALYLVKQEPDLMAASATLAKIAKGLAKAGEKARAQEVLSDAVQTAEMIQDPATRAKAQEALAEVTEEKALPWSERLSPAARAALVWAEDWCEVTNADEVYTEYVLAGLYEQPDGPVRRLLTLYEEDAAVRAALGPTGQHDDPDEPAPRRSTSCAYSGACRIASFEKSEPGIGSGGPYRRSSRRNRDQPPAPARRPPGRHSECGRTWVAERLEIDPEVLARLLAEAPGRRAAY